MSNAGPTRNCPNCIYFDQTSPDDDYPLGECRRYAPRPRVAEIANERQQEAWWPIVTQGEWCGEFHPSPRAYKKEPDGQENN